MTSTTSEVAEPRNLQLLTHFVSGGTREKEGGLTKKCAHSKYEDNTIGWFCSRCKQSHRSKWNYVSE